MSIGTVFLLNRGTVRVPRVHIEPDEVDAQKARLRQAIEISVQQLAAIRPRLDQIGGEQQRGILAAHEMMVRDETMLQQVESLIEEEHINAEWAVSQVIAKVRGLFDQLTDTYLRERRDDIDFTGDRILRNLIGQHADLGELAISGEGVIIVAHDLNRSTRRSSPATKSTLSSPRSAARRATPRSSPAPWMFRPWSACRGSCRPRAPATRSWSTGIDGSVMLRPSRGQLERGRRRSRRFHQINLSLLEAKALPARTPDGFSVAIAGNIELPGEVDMVLNRGGEGVGLYRTEYMFLGRHDLPTEDEHTETYCQVFRSMGERQVTVRTFDLGGDKIMGPAHLAGTEANPALGLRAIRLCLAHRSLFEVQIAGLLRAAAHGNLRIMLPMISGIEELLRAKEIIAEVAHKLTKAGVEHRADVPVGVMVEVPSAALCADMLAQHAAFLSIGTNDLLQYLLAIDRTNEQVAYLYQPLHPAVLRCLKSIVDAAQAAKVSVSVCGEMAGDPEYTAILLGLGVDQFSMNAGAMPRIKRLIREMPQRDCAALVAEAMAQPLVRDAERIVRGFVARHSAFMGPAFAQT